jgi:predicted permease
MDAIFLDVRYALRKLTNAKLFSLTVIAVLALGIGANIAVFTVLSGILLRPLPYKHPDRIVALTGAGSREFCCISYANLIRLRDASGTKLQVGMTVRQFEASIMGPGGRFQVQHRTVTSGLLPLLGVKAMLGRIFTEDQNQPGRNRVAVLSEDVWRKLYLSDPLAIGKTFTIQGENYEIIGVMPSGFSFPFGSVMSIWTPEPLTASNRSALIGEDHISGIAFARLPDGISPEQLAASMTRVQGGLAKDVFYGSLPARINIAIYQKTLNRDVQELLVLLYAVVFGIWALACLNATGMVLAKVLGRNREQAIRASLGATRVRLMQQAIVETLLLSGLGSAIGLIVGEICIKIIWSQIDRSLPLTSEIQVDWRVIACLALLTVATAVVVGLIPALRAMRSSAQGCGLYDSSNTASARHSLSREALIVGQIALTLVLLVSAGLSLRTIHALRQVPLGFSQTNVLTAGVMLNSSPLHGEAAGTSHGDVIRTAYVPLLDRMQSIPGVQAAALSSTLPLRSDFDAHMAVSIDHQILSPAQAPEASVRLASAGLATALGIPVLRGRFFNEADQLTSPTVAVVSTSFARQYLNGADPIGHELSMGGGTFRPIRVVGEIADMKQSNVVDSTYPEVYLCLQQTGPGRPLYGLARAFIQVAIRSALPADQLRVQFEQALHQVAPESTTTDVKTIREAVEDSIASQTLIAHLLESFAGVALLIATVGLYGLLSFTVTQRTREIGIRIALGAPQTNIFMLVVRRALVLIISGVAIGGVLAWFAVEFAKSFIFGVEVHDAPTFIATLSVLFAFSIIATLLPAHRAASVDPVHTLRAE